MKTAFCSSKLSLGPKVTVFWGEDIKGKVTISVVPSLSLPSSEIHPSPRFVYGTSVKSEHYTPNFDAFALSTSTLGKLGELLTFLRNARFSDE